MSLALVALLLIRLDAHMGELVTVPDLAVHFAVGEQQVCEHLEHAAGQACNGVQLRYDEWGYVIGALAIHPKPRARADFEAAWFD